MRPLFFSVLAVCALSLGACAKTSDNTDAKPTEAAKTEPATSEVVPAAAEAKVCCESFGYGSQMVKCCETYNWTTTAECSVEPGFVGGGKAVVGDELCANVK